jgi:hypothetical protein
MLKVEKVNYEDLTEEEQEIQPNNGSGKEYAKYIKLTHNSRTITILSDAVEPEDATFNRDFADVPIAIQKAYEIGFEDGYNTCNR